jgi:hypothetical protein
MNTAYSRYRPLTRGPTHVPRPKSVCFKVQLHPSVDDPSEARRYTRVVARDFCFVRNGYSIEILISGSILKLLLKNRSAFIENHFENRFQTKQSSLSTIYETEVSVQLQLGSGGSYGCIILQSGQSKWIRPTLPTLILFPSTCSKLFLEMWERDSGCRMPYFDKYSWL